MPIKKTSKKNDLHIILPDEQLNKIEFLKKNHPYKPSKTTLVSNGIDAIFEKELKENSHLKMKWEQAKQKEKTKIVPIKKNKGGESWVRPAKYWSFPAEH